MNNTYTFHHGWRFLRADAFPVPDALEKWRDGEGRSPVDPGYDDSGWETVALPHTWNDGELFSVPIEDGGSGQTRTAAFYRNTLDIPPEHRGKQALMTFEGVRQTCYVYINGQLAGYNETGVGPFGFDLTPFLHASGRNCIAVVTDNTSTRNIPFCGAETPNKAGVVPGSYLWSQEGQVPPEREGVGFSWNCNDFNPVVGGLAHPVRIVFKPAVYLTLPLYANLRTKGTYVYAEDFDLAGGSAEIHAEAEVRCLRKQETRCTLRVFLETAEGKPIGELPAVAAVLEACGEAAAPERSIVPEDAYRWDGAAGKYVPNEKAWEKLPETASPGTRVIHACGRIDGLRFWSPTDPCMVRVRLVLETEDGERDETVLETGFRKTEYDPDRGILINGRPFWLRGYAQRATNEWAAAGIVPEWMHDLDARWIRESNANHLRWMHVAAWPEDIRACDRQGIVCTQPAGDKEKETFGRQWRQRTELMRNVIIAYRNHPSILFWEAGNNVISAEHMREMRLLKEELDPRGGRFMGCRTINTEDALKESEYVGTMLNRHAARFLAEHGPITETEYSREEAPRRVWDDYSPPDYDYRGKWLGKGGKKTRGLDFYDLTAEDLALANSRGYSEFFHDRIGGASGKNLYSACAALCWTDSAQHGRQSWSENGRMSGRVDAIRVKKQSFDVFRVMQSAKPAVKILGHWNYPAPGGDSYTARKKRFNGQYWEETPEEEKRDPRRKTVYCVASYPVDAVRLKVNGEMIGTCEKPEDGFIFAFPETDVTESGAIEAEGLDGEGRVICRDRIETAGEPSRIRLTARTGPGGWRADGRDLAMIDLEITDREGRTCPLADMRLELQCEGNGIMLGGYNSGRFNGNGRNDNVIHQPFVYAECGTNRLLVRSTGEPGETRVRVSGASLETAEIRLESVPAATDTLVPEAEAGLQGMPGIRWDEGQETIPAIPEEDLKKYTPEAENYCKIMVNGQEPDFRGVRAVNRGGAVWGNVLCILERMKQQAPDRVDYRWNPEAGELTMLSGGREITARAGETHLKVDGVENLMDGAPYVTPEGIPVMEVSAMAAWAEGASVQYDDRIGALRITL